MSRLVLVVEDEEVSQKMASAVITHCGYQAKVVEDGEECLNVLKNGLNPAFILLDLELPKVGGLEVLQTLKKQGLSHSCPIIVFTAHHDQATVKEAIRYGADDYIIKPYRPDQLGTRIKNLVFEIKMDHLKKILAKLVLPDNSLIAKYGMQKQLEGNFDLYPVIEQNRHICIAVPKGQGPRGIAKLDDHQILLTVMIFGRTTSGLKKVWPRHNDLNKAG